MGNLFSWKKEPVYLHFTWSIRRLHVTQSAWTSAAMVLTQLSRNIPVQHQEGFSTMEKSIPIIPYGIGPWETMENRETNGRVEWWCHPWGRYQMETFSALLAPCVGNSPVTGEFPSQKPVTRSFNLFYDLRLNKRLSKQSRCQWIEPPLRS